MKTTPQWWEYIKQLGRWPFDMVGGFTQRHFVDPAQFILTFKQVSLKKRLSTLRKDLGTTLAYIFQHLGIAWHVTRLLNNQFLVLLVSVLLLLGMDQGRDFFQAAPHLSTSNILWALFALVLWSIFMWGSSRVLLNASLQIEVPLPDLSRLKRKKNASQAKERREPRFWNSKKRMVEWMVRWLPAFTASFPFILTLIGLIKTSAPRLQVITVLGLCTAMLILMSTAKIDVIIEEEGKGTQDTRDDRFILSYSDPIGAQHWQHFFTGLFALSLIPMLAFFFFPGKFRELHLLHRVGCTFGPIAICFFSFTYFTMWTTLVLRLQKIIQYPIVLTLLVLVLIFSGRNNNHTILPNFERKTERPTLMEQSEKWMNHKLQDRNIYPDHCDTGRVPVYFIAVEGGGIRGVNWTCRVMQILDEQVPKFHERTFAIAGASGGMLGAVFHETYRLGKERAWTEDNPEKYTHLISADYLSGTLMAYFGPDMTQYFLPWQIPAADRAKWFENSIEYELEQVFQDEKHPRIPLNSVDFFSFWEDTSYLHPSLFLQGTVVETAQQAIYSNINIEPSIFPNTLDVHALLSGDLNIVRASTLADRFPLILPPARLVKPGVKGKSVASIVDGGYFENTGIPTLLRIIDAFRHDPTNDYRIGKQRITPIIIFIQNGDTELRNENQTMPDAYSDYGKDFIAPLQTILHLQSGRTINTINNLRRRLQHDPELDFCMFRLNRNTDVEIPLAYYISKKASEEIGKQAAFIKNPSNTGDNCAKENYNCLQWLRNQPSCQDTLPRQRCWQTVLSAFECGDIQ